MTYDCWGSPIKSGMTYDCWGSPVKPGMTYGSGMTMLLSDAEIPEDIPKDFVGRDFADDGAEGVDGFADVLGGEVGWDAGG